MPVSGIAKSSLIIMDQAPDDPLLLGSQCGKVRCPSSTHLSFRVTGRRILRACCGGPEGRGFAWEKFSLFSSW